jgi:hypothetical protein
MIGAFDGILGAGSRMVREDGEDGLVEFLAKTDAWISDTRRSNPDPVAQELVRRFSFQCKIAFHTCYSALWTSLIPWLEARGIDEVSARFLRLWHCQNPTRVVDGRVVPDVLCGHVLSLHPISAYLMRDPGLATIVGRFVGGEAYDQVFGVGQSSECIEYWDMCGAILAAAYEYRDALEIQVANRPANDPNNAESLMAMEETRESVASILHAIASRAGWACRNCRGPLTYSRHRPTAAGTVRVKYNCKPCHLDVEHNVDIVTLRDQLRPAG